MNDAVLGSKLFAVAGQPIRHSLSPDIFQEAFRMIGYQAFYTRLTASEPEEVISLARESGLAGFNVTAPLKESIVPQMDCVDCLAQTVGAVNTVVVQNGKFIGYNTDVVGVAAALNDEGVNTAEQNKAVVLGAGGAGRAAAYALIRGGTREVVLVNRTREKGEKVAGNLNCRYAPLDHLNRELADADLFISCVPGNISLIESNALNPATKILDADYSSSVLRDMALQRGCHVLEGLNWLLRQAQAGFRHLTCLEAPYSVMTNVLRHAPDPAHNEKSNIALIGFMGTGKSTVGKPLSEKLGMDFLDTDSQVEKHFNLPVQEIFEQHGEDAFRQVEKSVINEIQHRSNTMFAIGGGGVKDEDSRRILRMHSKVIWLWTSVPVVLERVQKTRPILNTANPYQTAEMLLKARIPLYAESADLIVNAAGNPEPVVTEKILLEIDR